MTYTEIKSVKGVRNDVRSERFSNGDLLYARNVDIDESGKVQRRLGSRVLYPGAAHSAWNDKRQAFFVQDGILRWLQVGGTPIDIIEVTGQRVDYVSVNDKVFWSDGFSRGVVVNGVNHQWGVTPPTMIVATPMQGNFPTGDYLATMTFVNDMGVESGAPKSSVISLGANEGIYFPSLDVSNDPSIRTKNIYISTCDGDLPMLVANIPNSQTSLSLIEMARESVPVRTQFMGPPPSGQIVGYYNGRTYVADGRYLWYSLPYEYELFDQRTGYFTFDSDICTFAAVSDGVFIGTTNTTVFLGGAGPESFSIVPVSSVGSVLGTEVVASPDQIGMDEIKGSTVFGSAVLWVSTKGLVLGTDGGVIRELTSGKFIPPAGLKVGGALLKLRNGTPQYIVSLFS